jgi:hypothetical protein
MNAMTGSFEAGEELNLYPSFPLVSFSLDGANTTSHQQA